MSLFDLKTYSCGLDFEEFKKDERAEEIFPGLIKTTGTGEDGGVTYIAKMLIPLGDKKTIILSDQTKDALKTQASYFTAHAEDIKIDDLLTIPDFETESLSFGNLSESFQKATEEIKTKFEELFKK